MEKNNPKSVLVIFGKESPPKNKNWWGQFDKVIRQEELTKLVGAGSIREAYELTNNLSRFSKLVDWRGYELWWMHYDSLYTNFCLPYTQYSSLLEELKVFDEVYLFRPPHAKLFKYYLEAAGRHYHILGEPFRRKLLFLPLGVFIQLVFSAVFLPWLIIKRPKLMLFTSDKFDPPNDYDFRYKFIYGELRKKQIPFAEFIRSLESWPIIVQHAWQRKRPVIYSAAIIYFVHLLAGLFGRKKITADDFWQKVAAHYLQNTQGTIWSVRAMEFILRLIGIRSAVITTGCDRTFHEILGCRLANIKTVGIQHGAQIKHYNCYDFMPGFDGQKQLSLDQYGLWSEWWRKYFIQNSRVFRPEQLFVVGPMRPLTGAKSAPKEELRHRGERLKVLYISEGLAAPAEVLPYILAVLEAKDFELHFKFRPYRDVFELWLKENQRAIYDKIFAKSKILRGSTQEAIAQCDVVVGSHSSAVLDALLQLKPLVLFWTNKWGDYFEIKNFDDQGHFFAENPAELIGKIRKSSEAPKEDLKKLQIRYFGDPYQNGSKWVVDQAEKLLGALKFPEQK